MNILDKFRLAGKTALVTGASRGLGQAIAAGLAEAGADIVNVSRSEATELGNIVEGLGRQFMHVEADLSDLDVVSAEAVD